MAVRRSLLTLTAAGASTVGLLAGGFLAASPAGAAGTTGATAPAPAQAGCPTGHLPASVLGNPNVKPGQTGGVYIGHGTGAASEKVGYGLAVTHAGHAAVVFTGRITASAPITAVKVRDERHDIIRYSPDHKTLTFLFVNYGALDGVVFRADCAKTVSFSLAANGHELAPTRVFLGAQRVHPTSNPFTLERH
jgi:hypothetical protein